MTTPHDDPTPASDAAGRASSDSAARHAIVTGAAQGIGRTIAERLLADGAQVTILDRSPTVHDVAAEIGAQPVEVDLADETATATALAGATEGRAPWLLVNNAGTFLKQPLLEMSLDDWDRVQRINTRSCVVTMQAIAPMMAAAGGGRIVNMASMAAKLGTPGESAYAASKAAVVALSRIAAMELGADQITVNAVCPGYVLTDLGAATRSEEQVAAWTSMSPLGRLASTSDVAGIVSFLASDDAAYVTGQALNITGGMCTW